MADRSSRHPILFLEQLHSKDLRPAVKVERVVYTYPLPRFSWVPRIETVLVANDDLAPQGGGEPAIVNMGGVVANAIFDATGARMLRLPMTRERVMAEIRRG